jgi:hypothetical protein
MNGSSRPQTRFLRSYDGFFLRGIQDEHRLIGSQEQLVSSAARQKLRLRIRLTQIWLKSQGQLSVFGSDLRTGPVIGTYRHGNGACITSTAVSGSPQVHASLGNRTAR